jgi:hypothetical protein
LTKRYDALEIAGIEKLVRRGTDVIYYCTTEEDLNALTTTETPTNRNDTNQTTPEADTDIETETNTEPETETNMYLSIREFGNMTAGRFKTTESDTQEILH